MNGEPIPFRHGSHREWALELQRQHERLRQAVDPGFAKAAKASARDVIRQKGYRRAADEAMPTQVPTSNVEIACGNPCADDRETAIAIHPTVTPGTDADEKVRKLEELQCRRKLRHANYWTAVQHAVHLGRDVRTYPCPICDGIHCGNAPESERTRDYRRARKRLRTIDRRLVALDHEWVSLLGEKKALLRHVGEPDVLAAMMSEITGQVRRLSTLVKMVFF